MVLKALKPINARGIMVNVGEKFSVDQKFGEKLLETKAAEIWKDKPASGKK